MNVNKQQDIEIDKTKTKLILNENKRELKRCEKFISYVFIMPSQTRNEKKKKGPNYLKCHFCLPSWWTDGGERLITHLYTSLPHKS